MGRGGRGREQWWRARVEGRERAAAPSPPHLLHQRVAAGDAAVDHAHDRAELLGEVPLERERVDVLERVLREVDERGLADLAPQAEDRRKRVSNPLRPTTLRSGLLYSRVLDVRLESFERRPVLFVARTESVRRAHDDDDDDDDDDETDDNDNGDSLRPHLDDHVTTHSDGDEDP